jgi:hypothetical protein
MGLYKVDPICRAFLHPTIFSFKGLEHEHLLLFSNYAQVVTKLGQAF